jgi:hypothetical protein
MANELSTIPAELLPSQVHYSMQSQSMSHFASSRNQNENVTIQWDNIVFSTIIKDKVKSSVFNPVYIKRNILKGISGEMTNGELLAILGPTGICSRLINYAFIDLSCGLQVVGRAPC